jgi:hypothetical protein
MPSGRLPGHLLRADHVGLSAQDGTDLPAGRVSDTTVDVPGEELEMHRAGISCVSGVNRGHEDISPP